MKTGRPSQNLVWRNEIRSWILKPSTQWFAELNKTQKLENRCQDLKSREILEKVGRLWACGSEPAGCLLSVRVLRWIQMDSTQKQLFFSLHHFNPTFGILISHHLHRNYHPQLLVVDNSHNICWQHRILWQGRLHMRARGRSRMGRGRHRQLQVSIS